MSEAIPVWILFIGGLGLIMGLVCVVVGVSKAYGVLATDHTDNIGPQSYQNSRKQDHRSVCSVWVLRSVR